MSTRRRNLFVLLGLVALAAVGFALAQPGDGNIRGALAAVPRDSFAVVTVDVAALHSSPLSRTLGANVPGIGKLAEVCGFNPLARVRELAVALPEGEGDFGVIAIGELRGEEIIACAKKVLAARGAEARITQRGAFTVLQASDDARDTAPRIALREGAPDGMLVVGRGAWHTAILETIEGRRPGLDRNGPHASLRTTLGTRPRTVTGTAVLPKSLRDRLKREMEGEAGDKPNAAFAGVLAVETAAIALNVGAEAELFAVLRCETAEACGEVKKLIERKRLALSQDFGARLVGLGPLIDSLSVTVEGTELRASARAPAEDVARAIDRILQMKAPRPAPTPPPPPAAREPRPQPSVQNPDERLRARGATADAAARD